MSEPLYARDDFQKCLASWWSGLAGRTTDGEEGDRAPNRKHRAELRRAKRTMDVCLSEAFAHGFLSALKDCGIVPRDDEIEGLARLAGLAAHVQTLAERPMGGIMAQPRASGAAVAVSPQRFRKLLTIEDPDDFFVAMVRMLRLTDGRANLASLSRACQNWTDTTRRWWAMEYYNVLPSKESEHATSKR
ncbi:type I-E CRISPR-associated protein Cse2/CasB [Desulfohalovibrio reitneri]|uniref:type I-E CRISPR-associated protein Cse2/CasB n=1 Tax=Desulfohalovibrio reitneri TaxID=1307759 RepID=UPI0004A77293|nr:type I-E CRISPR-associated protein Cse2/CasB [Desulfohalovibrio reitneri]